MSPATAVWCLTELAPKWCKVYREPSRRPCTLNTKQSLRSQPSTPVYPCPTCTIARPRGVVPRQMRQRISASCCCNNLIRAPRVNRGCFIPLTSKPHRSCWLVLGVPKAISTLPLMAVIIPLIYSKKISKWLTSPRGKIRITSDSSDWPHSQTMKTNCKNYINRPWCCRTSIQMPKPIIRARVRGTAYHCNNKWALLPLSSFRRIVSNIENRMVVISTIGVSPRKQAAVKRWLNLLSWIATTRLRPPSNS